ncbi:MAG TPA: glycoside hydrolase family 3 protein [Candidatus Hungatella pullicola]|nr:glycoside hydrolase family 3 protein [Candidatus Hungatella pullicola]
MFKIRKKKRGRSYYLFPMAWVAVLTGVIFIGVYNSPLGNEPDQQIKADEPSQAEQKDKKETGYEDEGKKRITENGTEYKLEEKIDNWLETMTLEEKTAQLFVVTPETIGGEEAVDQAGETLLQGLREYPVGGLVYFSQNLISPEQTRGMLNKTRAYGKRAAGLPLFLCVDEEGGTVARIGNNPEFSVDKVEDMEQIGGKQDRKAAYEAGKTIGNYLSDLGFNLDFAPVADVFTNPDNQVVKKRSFGSDPQLVSDMAYQVEKGLSDCGILGVYKHFPGHGATSGDTHEGYAYTEKELEEMLHTDLLPFFQASEQKVPLIMAGHIGAPKVTGNDMPSSLSYTMITEVLREKLGYDGIVITDALNMGAIQEQYDSAQACVMAVKAGADMLLMPADFEAGYKGILEAVETGTITEDRLDESVRRILRIKLNLTED